MTEHIRTPRSRLFDLEWEETSFVGEGDNPGAHILFTKERDDNEHIVAKAIAEVAKEDEESMTETVLKTSTGRVLRTQSDAVAWMGEEAEKLQKQDPRMGRADALWRVYETHNVVLERSYELPPASWTRSSRGPTTPPSSTRTRRKSPCPRAWASGASSRPPTS